MAERTAAEVLAEKINAAWRASGGSPTFSPHAVAKILAEDPAITVRTDMVVERFIVEIHRGGISAGYAARTPETVHRYLTTTGYYADRDDHRIIVRPYPEVANP